MRSRFVSWGLVFAQFIGDWATETLQLQKDAEIREAYLQYYGDEHNQLLDAVQSYIEGEDTRLENGLIPSRRVVISPQQRQNFKDNVTAINELVARANAEIV
jgi:hypothetical protein